MESQKKHVLDLLEKISNQTTTIQLMLTEWECPMQVDSETIEEMKHQPKIYDKIKTSLNKEKEDPTPKTATESEFVQKSSFCHKSLKSWFCWKKRKKDRSLSNEVVMNSSAVSVRPYTASITSMPTEGAFSNINIALKNASVDMPPSQGTTYVQTNSTASIDPIADPKIPVDSLLHYKILLQISQTVDSLDAFINCIADITNYQQRVDDIIAAAQVFYGRINQIQASTFSSTDYQRIVATSIENEITPSTADAISPRNDVAGAASENQNLKNVVADVTVQMNVSRIFEMCPTNQTALKSNTRASCQNHSASTEQSLP